MPTAETAKLIVELDLKEKLTQGVARVQGALRGLGPGLAQTGRGVAQLGGGLALAGAKAAAFTAGIVAAAGTAGIGFLALQVRRGIDSLNELQNVETQTGAVIASTRGIAGVTAAQVRALAEEYENLNATMDDKVIQSGENLLLTFTSINERAFKPALQAALDMNQAMGGGPEGLQSTILQLGKALQDPVRGATALRRVGVNLSQQQQDQIRTLVEQNDLYGAQRLILDELNKEFGGSFAAAGKTREATTARLADQAEDLQQTLARPIAPALERFKERVIDVMAAPATVSAVAALGDQIAGLFSPTNLDRGAAALERGISLLTPENFAKAGDAARNVFGFLAEVPWSTIGQGLQITGQAAKVAIDAFTSLPPEAQGVVIGLLAANKLSGGLVGSGLGNIAGGIGQLLAKGLKTIIAGNVTVVGGNVTGGGGGIPGAGGGGGVAGGAGRVLSLGNILRGAGGALLAVGGNQLQASATDAAGQATGALGTIGGGALAGSAFGPAGTAVGAAAGAIAAAVQQGAIARGQIEAGRRFEVSVVEDRLAGATTTELIRLREDLSGQLSSEMGNPLDGILKAVAVNPHLEQQLADVNARIEASKQADARHAAAQERGDFSQINEFRRGSNERRIEANQAATLQNRLREVARERLTTLGSRYADIGGESNRRLANIERKRFSPETIEVTTHVDVGVSISAVQSAARSQAISRGAVTNSGFQEGV